MPDPKTRLRIVAADFNPWLKWIWVERLPQPLPPGYSGGRRVRQYRLTHRRVHHLYNACVAAGFEWSQDNNGTHLRSPWLAAFPV